MYQVIGSTDLKYRNNSIKCPGLYSKQYPHNRKGMVFIGGYIQEFIYIASENIGGRRSAPNKTNVPSGYLGILCITIYLDCKRKMNLCVM